jgi:hypothetical protein
VVNVDANLAVGTIPTNTATVAANEPDSNTDDNNAIANAVVAEEAQSLIYQQDWESGIGGWFSKHGSSDPVVPVEDPSAPSPTTVQQVTRQEGAGNYVSPPISLQGGRTYCVASWIRWAGGGRPFVGIDNLDASGEFLGENWLIGQEGNTTGQVCIIMASQIKQEDAWP